MHLLRYFGVLSSQSALCPMSCLPCPPTPHSARRPRPSAISYPSRRSKTALTTLPTLDLHPATDGRIETAKLRGVNPAEYLLAAVRAADRGETLMPWHLRKPEVSAVKTGSARPYSASCICANAAVPGIRTRRQLGGRMPAQRDLELTHGPVLGHDGPLPARRTRRKSGPPECVKTGQGE